MNCSQLYIFGYLNSINLFIVKTLIILYHYRNYLYMYLLSTLFSIIG